MTVKQKQCLLSYMGLYTGNLDGKFGPLCKEATREAQKMLGLSVDGAFGPITEKAILSHIAGTPSYTTLISCLDAIKKLPEYKALEGLLNG